MVWAGVRVGGPRQRGNGFVERRDVLAHHLGPEHRVRVHHQRRQDRFVRDRVTEPRRALSYRVPVVYGAAIFSAPLQDRQRGVRVVDSPAQPAQSAGAGLRLIVPRVGDGDWVEGVEVIRAFLGHDQVGGGAGGWLGGGHGAEHGNGAVDGSSSKDAGAGCGAFT
jgi:hypothetical protein